MRTLAVIQARMGSSRLPGKVLAQVAGRPMLWYVIRRTQLAKLVDQVVVAIPDDTVEDLEIAAVCAEWKVPCVAGPGQDVLGRYLAVARAWQPRPDLIVRITADCPLIDPEVIDAVIRLCLKPAGILAGMAPSQPQLDPVVAYASNIFPYRDFPDGLDVEAFPLGTLEQLARFATEAADREHVTAFLHRFPKMFTAGGRSLRSVCHDPSMGDARWTVDTQEDLDFVRNVFEYFRCPWDASMAQIIDRCRARVQLPGSVH